MKIRFRLLEVIGCEVAAAKGFCGCVQLKVSSSKSCRRSGHIRNNEVGAFVVNQLEGPDARERSDSRRQAQWVP